MQRPEPHFADHPPWQAAPPGSDSQLAADEAEHDPDSFSVRADIAGDRRTTVLSPRGEIDLDTAPRLLEALLPALEHGSGPVVIDLSDVRFMDTTGGTFSPTSTGS